MELWLTWVAFSVALPTHEQLCVVRQCANKLILGTNLHSAPLAHTALFSSQTCFSSSTTKTATSLAYLIHPTPGVGQEMQTQPALVPAPQAAACLHPLHH